MEMIDWEGPKMDKTIWKKILDSMPAEDFIRLTSACEIHVKGFRKISSENYKLVKPKLMTEALKNGNLERICLLFDKKSELISLQEDDDVEDVVDYRSMELEQLMDAFEKGAALFEILGSLHSSSNPNHIKLAKEFEKQISLKEHQTNSNSLQPDMGDVERMQENDEIKHLQKDLDNFQKALKAVEKKLIKSEAKNNDWQIKFQTLESEYHTAKRNWKEEKKELIKSKTSLQQEVTTKENQLLKIDEKIRQLTDNIVAKDQEIQDKNAKISHLNAKLLTSNQQNHVPQFVGDNHIKSQKNNRKKIAIIGNPKNKRIEETTHVNLEVIEVTDVDKKLAESAFECFDELWLLTYKVPSTKQKLIFEKVNKPIVELRTFIALLNLVENGE
jgi:chromosome segregation ATPase